MQRDRPRDEAAGQHPLHRNGPCDGSLLIAARRKTADSFSFDENERDPKGLPKISLLRESMWDCGRLQSSCFVFYDMNQLIGKREESRTGWAVTRSGLCQYLGWFNH